MRNSTVFLNGFLDGFTMSGFLTKLSPPGAPETLFAPEGAESVLTLEPDEVHAIPEQELERILRVLTREVEERKNARAGIAGIDYATER